MGDGAYAGTQMVSVAIAVGLAILAGIATKLKVSVRGQGGLLMGWDRRASTSKTVAVVWTVLLVYMLLTLIFIAHSHSETALRDTLNNAPDLYFVFLGGPYAAAVLAKVGVTHNIKNQTLQKSDGSGVFNPLDVIRDDQGAADVYDFQYTIFNLTAMIAVVIAFAAHPGHGLPQLPDFLALLTGGSAFVYLANKVTGSNPPLVTSVSPRQVRVRDWVRISGTNLFDPNATSGATIVKVGPALVAPADLQPVTGGIAFRVPAVGPGPQVVSMVTNSGTSVPDGTVMSVTVDADIPQLYGFSTTQVKAGASLTLLGTWFYPALSIDASGKIANPVQATSVGLSVAGAPAPVGCPVDPARAQTDESLTVTVPAGTVGAVTGVTIRGSSIPLNPGLSLRIIP